MNATVMVIDDSAMIRMQVSRALAGAGFGVVQANDGQDAWEQLARGVRPALLVCDVNMPRMNGIELLERLSEDPSLSLIPVVMLTTEGQPSVVRQARRLGAKGWLIKPFQADLLVAAVTSLVTRAA